MSTKAIRRALAAARSCIKCGEPWTPEMERAFEAADNDVESIERAAKAYQRPMAADRTEWLEMVKTMSSIAKDAP